MVIRYLATLAAVVFLSPISIALSADIGSERLQGIWFGDGPHPLSRNVLVVRDDSLVVITPLGAFRSTFTVNDKPALAEIDIERYDGRPQLGVYEMDETQLRMELGRPHQPRPTVNDVRFPSDKPHWHTTFSRRPTPEGLAVLQKHLPLLSLPDQGGEQSSALQQEFEPRAE